MLEPTERAPERLPDPEWTALQAALKPAVRMTMAEPRARALLARLAARDVAGAIGSCGKPAEVALYVARERGRVAALVEAERRTLEGRGADERAVGHEALGALLGYPSCCVGAFVAHARGFDGPTSPLREAHEDVVHARAALAKTTRARARLNALLWPQRRLLVSFYPCAYDCPRALAYAAALEHELARRAPEATAALLEDLACTVLVDEDGARAVARRDGRIVEPPRGAGAAAREIDRALAARLEAARAAGASTPTTLTTIAFDAR